MKNVAKVATAVLAFLLSNIHTWLFLGGMTVLYQGVSGFSKPAANIVLGVLLIAAAMWPYVKKA